MKHIYIAIVTPQISVTALYLYRVSSENCILGKQKHTAGCLSTQILQNSNENHAFNTFSLLFFFFLFLKKKNFSLKVYSFLIVSEMQNIFLFRLPPDKNDPALSPLEKKLLTHNLPVSSGESCTPQQRASNTDLGGCYVHSPQRK